MAEATAETGHASGWECRTCGASVPISRAFTWKCPYASAVSPHHVLRLVQAPAPLRARDDANPFRAFQRYLSSHAKHVARADVLRWSLEKWLLHFGTATVADLTPARLRDFVAELTKTMTSGSARRALADGKAALNWLYREGEIESVPHVALPPANEPRERIATLNEAAALIWDLCNGQRSARAIAALLSEAYPGDDGKIEADLETTLSTFLAEHVIELA